MAPAQPPPPPPRQKLASVREDPRAEPAEPMQRPAVGNVSDAELRRLVVRLTDGEFERRQRADQVAKDIATIAEGIKVLVSHARFDSIAPREKTDSRLQLETQLAEAQSILAGQVREGVETLTKANSIAVKRGIAHFFRDLFVDIFVTSAKLGWKAAIGAMAIAVTAAVGGYVVHDILPRVTTHVPAAHP